MIRLCEIVSIVELWRLRHLYLVQIMLIYYFYPNTFQQKSDWRKSSVYSGFSQKAKSLLNLWLWEISISFFKSDHWSTIRWSYTLYSIAIALRNIKWRIFNLEHRCNIKRIINFLCLLGNKMTYILYTRK